MKPRTLALLLLSHGGLFVLGSWLSAGKATPAPVTMPTEAVPKAPARPPADEAIGNPIFRASGADFQAAWAEMLAGPRAPSGEPSGNSLSFFIDWCAIDPEGAVQGLGRLHAPRFAHNFLNNAVNYHGAILAPALVKHWRELKRLSDHKVEHALGRSVNALAKEDPESAAALTGGLPRGMRRGAYDSLFERQDAATIERLLKNLPPVAPSAPEEAIALWQAVAEAVDAADSQRGLWDWLARADNPAARRAFTTEGMNKARRAEDWSGFFDAVERMDPSTRAEMRKLVGEVARTYDYSPEVRAAISAECRRQGLDDWLDAMTAD